MDVAMKLFAVALVSCMSMSEVGHRPQFGHGGAVWDMSALQVAAGWDMMVVTQGCNIL